MKIDRRGFLAASSSALLLAKGQLSAATLAESSETLNSYYYIGHFSKFVQPGAKRIASSPSRSPLLSTAFINPDGKVSVVVMNKGDQKISYHLWLDGQAAEVDSLPHSIQTLVF